MERVAKGTVRRSFQWRLYGLYTFYAYEKQLNGLTISELLHHLLRRQAALQLAYRQPYWDILIPVYFGGLDKVFDPARASAVFIQVRNRDQASKFEMDPHNYAKLFSHTEDPILYILMDLGTEEHRVDVYGLPNAKTAQHPCTNSTRLKQYLFGIHAMGAGSNTYRRLELPE